jgi:acyl carrier protein
MDDVMAKTEISKRPTEASLLQWLQEFVATRAGVRPEDLDVDASFESLGLDSRGAVQASGALEKALGLRLPPGLLYEHPTVRALARHLAEELGCEEER